MKKLFLILFLLLPSLCFADTYAVNPTTCPDGWISDVEGHDKGGTLACGDILVIDSEDWNGNNFYIYGLDVCDDSGNKIEIRNESGKVVTIDNDDSGKKTNKGGLQIVDSRNILIDGTIGLTQGSEWGFVINSDTDTSNGPYQYGIAYGIRMQAVDGIEIKGVHVEDSSGNGIQFQHLDNKCPDDPPPAEGVSCSVTCTADNVFLDTTPDGNLFDTGIEISYCKIERPGWNGSAFFGGNQGGYVGTSDISTPCDGLRDKVDTIDDVSIHHNIFNNISGRAWQTARAVDDNANGWAFKFYNNTIILVGQHASANTYGRGLHASGYSSDIEIYNNTFDMHSNVASVGVTLQADDRCVECGAVNPEYNIHDNWIWNTPTGGIGIRVMSNNASNVIVNNTLVNEGTVSGNTGGNSDYGILADYDVGTYEYNLVVGDDKAGTIQGVTDPRKVSNMESGSISAQNFLDCNDDNDCVGDFNLTATSPALEENGSSNYSANDILGISRPQGTYADIGAYEFTGAATPTILQITIGKN